MRKQYRRAWYPRWAVARVTWRWKNRTKSIRNYYVWPSLRVSAYEMAAGKLWVFYEFRLAWLSMALVVDIEHHWSHTEQSSLMAVRTQGEVVDIIRGQGRDRELND